MPVPWGRLTGPIVRVAESPAVKLAGFGLIGLQTASSLRGQIRGGKNPALAVGSEAVNLAMMTFVGFEAQVALQATGLAFRGGQAVVRNIQRYNQQIRLAKTPFSARFEHSDATYRAQVTGMQQIGTAWSTAGEAGQFAQRYGRR